MYTAQVVNKFMHNINSDNRQPFALVNNLCTGYPHVAVDNERLF